MKRELQKIARLNGQLARVKARRVAVILKMQRDDPGAARWLRQEAALLAKRVAYLLRQADLIGGMIERQERSDYQGAKVHSRV